MESLDFQNCPIEQEESESELQQELQDKVQEEPVAAVAPKLTKKEKKKLKLQEAKEILKNEKDKNQNLLDLTKITQEFLKDEDLIARDQDLNPQNIENFNPDAINDEMQARDLVNQLLNGVEPTPEKTGALVNNCQECISNPSTT